MSRVVVRFWLSAVGLALAFAVLTAWLIPYEALQLRTGADRWRVWLLTLWTGGMLGICFGLAALLWVGGPLGFREVAEAGSLSEAMAERRRARRQGAGFHENFGWWLIATGAILVGIYFVAWGVA